METSKRRCLAPVVDVQGDIEPGDAPSIPEMSLRFFQNLSPRSRLLLRDCRICESESLDSSRGASDSPLAIRAIIRGDSDFAEGQGGSGGVLGSTLGADEECAPSKSCGQSPVCAVVSSPESGVTPLDSDATPSPAAAKELICTEGSVAVVAELTVCDLEEGTDCRDAVADGFDVLCLLLAPEGRAGDDGLGALGEAGTLREAGLPWLVTKIVVKLSSLLPRLEPG